MTSIKKLSILEICYISTFAAIIAVCAQIRIPLPFGVPMTLQTFAIPLAGIILGAKNGSIATLIYILLGILGIPVFSGFASGVGTVFGATGGFILSFPILALFSGIAGNKTNKLLFTLWLVAGATFNLLFGMMYYSFVTQTSLNIAFTKVIFPFIPAAIIKTVLAAVVGRKIKLLQKQFFQLIA